MSTKSKRIGTRQFTDGIERDVWLDPDGRQYVLDGKERVYGVWLVDAGIADTPLEVPAE